MNFVSFTSQYGQRVAVNADKITNMIETVGEVMIDPTAKELCASSNIKKQLCTIIYFGGDESVNVASSLEETCMKLGVTL